MTWHIIAFRSCDGTGSIGFVGLGWVLLAIDLMFRFAGATLCLRNFVDDRRDVLAASPP
jgi:hypothetical protein